VLIPAFGGSATFYWAYDQFGSTLGSALMSVITHPLHALRVFVTPWVKARTMMVVGDTLGLDFPFCTPSQQAQELAHLPAHGYSQVFADDGYVVLHRPAGSRTAQALAHPLAAARLHTNICY
jgi:hypothetical protein